MFRPSFIFAMLVASSLSASTLRGIVRGPQAQPVAGASVAIGNLKTVETGTDGMFLTDVPDGVYRITVRRSGYTPERRTVTAGETVEITLAPAMVESIVVSGIRADASAPVTKTDLQKADLERLYHQQDVPLLLRDTPSVNAWTESGVGESGYSYLSLRGISPTRINFTLDGVPLADSEDMGTYFVDFPDLTHSLQSIQVQRGVGTSTVGTPSFGGSVNLASVDVSRQTSMDARIAGGSFGSRFATVGYQSGALPGGFAAYARVSGHETSGFRRNSGTDQGNIFVSAIRQSEQWQWRVTAFSGHERQHLSFYAADAETLRSDLRFNPLQPEERDSFGYNLANLQYLRSLRGGDALTASTYYQRGFGWYQLYDDSTGREGLRRYGLDGVLLGSLVTYSRTRGALTTNLGMHVNRFRREHTRDLVGAGRDYQNDGVKDEGNAFAKVTLNVRPWLFYGDAQLRYTDFSYHGAVALRPIRRTFFNPKVGVRREISPRASLYVSAGLSRREPTRNDLFQGQDNASFAHDLHAVRPERLLDFETGLDFAGSALKAQINLYAMQFHDEIAATGELSDIGLMLRRNVDRSDRRGLEINAVYDARTSVRLRTVASLSRNRISAWTQFYDVYDRSGTYLESKPIVYRNVQPVMTPSVMVNQTVEYTPSARSSFSLTGRYVGRSFLDNTNNPEFATPSLFSLDGNASQSLSRGVRLSLQVNNVLNNKRLFANGYSYLYLARDRSGNDAVTGTSYFFPQATRNAVLMLDFKL